MVLAIEAAFLGCFYLHIRVRIDDQCIYPQCIDPKFEETVFSYVKMSFFTIPSGQVLHFVIPLLLDQSLYMVDSPEAYIFLHVKYEGETSVVKFEIYIEWFLQYIRVNLL